MQKSFVYLCKGKNCFVTIKKTAFLPRQKQPLYSPISHNPPMRLSQIPFKKRPFHRSFRPSTVSGANIPSKFGVILLAYSYLCSKTAKILALSLKNIQASLIFLARLFVSLQYANSTSPIL